MQVQLFANHPVSQECSSDSQNVFEVSMPLMIHFNHKHCTVNGTQKVRLTLEEAEEEAAHEEECVHCASLRGEVRQSGEQQSEQGPA